MRVRALLVVALFLCGCQPHTQEDCRRRCEALVEDLAIELEGISSREQLQKDLSKIRNLYTEIAKLMVLASELEGSEELPAVGETPANRRLRAELIRIYDLEGAQGLMERAQTDALARLERAQVELS